ncbi:5'/3'-nucleotidase SurE [Desulfolutivibrio sulfoxidireducens]|uniref:5'/3'-nucleotidase SurE n=1 Tax=Desulfolutivibrio sulfoxidireducens TaxID=2773299 RepID=UPI00159E02FE|nr:5'/3'-nucleotidase SurE [Desulfolutivibrio sulfoxidireducens]QLA18852.1 5'/3'-nucleotidase SurE [Desulfolutivibrio sulfoxidireducens]
MKILLTNDDGIQAVGIRALHRALQEAGHEVSVVAPITEQSAVGHAVTLASPLRVKEFRENGFFGLGVSGTPADCVKLALTALLPAPPELVVSGINHGANVGVDILYSGTVSAATEGALAGLPALAVSVDDFSPRELSEQGAYAARFVASMSWDQVPRGSVLNLNFPRGPMAAAKPLRACPQTQATYKDWFDERTDPRGRPYYWLDGIIPGKSVIPGTDRDLLTQGHVTLTPLRFDFTDTHTLSRLPGLLGGNLSPGE